MNDGLRELARANDTIDRLREVKLSLEQDARRRERLNDLVMRSVLLLLIAGVLALAVYNL